MGTAGMHNLTTLIKRLEAATSRLEDIASSTPGQSSEQAQEAAGQAVGALKAEGVNGNLYSSGTSTPAKNTPVEAASPSVQAFDDVVRNDMKPFADLSEKLGGLVAEQVAAFCVTFKAQREVLLIAEKSKEPSQTDPAYPEILRDLTSGIERVTNVREKNRKSPQEHHLAMIADGIEMLAWVTIRAAPDKYVSDVLGGAQFYGNKILTANKDNPSGAGEVEWVKSFVKLCGALITYIKQHHPKGLEWNASGLAPAEALKQVKLAHPASNSTAAINAARAGPSGAPPPPPLPPPLPQLDVQAAPSNLKSSASGGDMGAVFEQLNRGEDVTTGLRKVDKSEMTHKNPSLRASSAVPARSDSTSSAGREKSPAPPIKKQKPESMRQKKPARKVLEANKWSVENFENSSSPVEIEVEKNQSILISRCKATTVRVTGKANAISIDNCSRLDIVVDSLVSAVDVINSSNFRIQVLGTLPSISLDKVDVGTVFLSMESMATEIYTSKSTSINITLPPLHETDDSVECPVPEQIRSTIVDGKLVSEIVKQEG